MTKFIRFLADCQAYVKDNKHLALDILIAHNSLICRLLSKKPSASMAKHKEEQDALSLFTSLIIPNKEVVGNWACALIKRGAHLETRNVSTGNTPLQTWCEQRNILSSCIIMLLEEGADLYATPNMAGFNALHLLCRFGYEQILIDLASAGWLETSDLDIPNAAGETLSTFIIRHVNTDALWANRTGKQLQNIIVFEQARWHPYVRPAILAMLQAHPSLIPPLAEIIVSYMNGRMKETPVDTDSEMG